MKILMFGWEFPPHNSGGLGTACLGITKELDKQGVKVTFVLPRNTEIESSSTKFIFAESKDDSNIKIKPINSILLPYADSSAYQKSFENSKKDNQNNIYASNLEQEVERYALEVSNLIENEDFDIIHAHDWLTFPAALKAKELTNKPLIVHVHSTEIDRTGNAGNPKIFEIEKNGMQKADQIIAVSNHTKNVIIENYNINPDKITVIHNGIDADEIKQIEQSKNKLKTTENLDLSYYKQTGYNLVLFVGRLTFQKGVEYLLKAAQKVLELNPKTLFIIAGSGDMYEVLIHLSADLGIADKILFTGFLRGVDLENLYQQADLFIMPSVSEPFGLVGLESLIRDTPVILSKSSGVSEVIQNALKVDFWDVNQAANLIVSVLDYTTLKETLTHLGSKEAKTVTWEKSVNKIIDLYCKTIKI